MAATRGNSFWRNRYHSGRNPIFSDPEDMWQKCCTYFEWCEKAESKLTEERIFQFQGAIVRGKVKHVRPMTVRDLCIFLGISRSTWYDYKNKEGFSDIIERVEDVIYTQKFNGAANDLFNANIISRDLKLKDTTEVEHTGEARFVVVPAKDALPDADDDSGN